MATTLLHFSIPEYYPGCYASFKSFSAHPAVGSAPYVGVQLGTAFL
jgi:hypothetical protein